MTEGGGGQAVAALIDARRKALGWSDAQVAREARVHHNTLGNWRAGKGVSLAALSQVADALGLSLTSLCDAFQGRAGHPDDLPPSEGAAAVLERLAAAIEALDDRLAAVEAGQDDLAGLLRAERASDGVGQ